MAFDPAMALQVKVPQQNLRETIATANDAFKLKGMIDYRAALDAGATPEQASRILSRTDPEMAGAVVGSEHAARTTEYRKNYHTSGNLVDLRGDPQSFETAARGARTDFDQGAEERSRLAYDVLHEQDPVRKKQKWQTYGDDWAKRGWINPTEWARMRNTPNDAVLQGVIRHSANVIHSMGATGETAGAVKAAEAPHQVHTITPGERVILPGQMPGAPTAGQPTMTPGNYAPRQVKTVPYSAPGTGGSIVGKPGESIMPTGNEKPVPPAQRGDKQSVNKYASEVPVVEVAPLQSSGTGVIEPGQHPMAMEAQKLANENMQKDIEPTAANAAKTKASLGTMENTLKSGKVSTSQMQDIKMAVGGFLNVFMGTDKASEIIGQDLPSAEALRKEMVRMGLLFARQTEGAREAVMAIQIALGANPQMLNTTEGNKKIIGILKSAADYDIERSKAAQAYYQKQLKETGTGHLVGFDTWFSTNHPPAAYMSKVVPYPVDGLTRNDLVKGVTYAVPIKDANGNKVPLKDKDGRVIPDKYETENLMFNGSMLTDARD